MLGMTNRKPIAEHEAKDDIERVYHEIRQTMRVSGVNLNFRTWASWENFLPLMWDAMRPNAETVAFERAGDDVRKQALEYAAPLGTVNALAGAQLGESQRLQVWAALRLYHYINPKLLILTSAVKLGLDGEAVGGAGGESARIVLGPPENMYAMEMVDEEPDNEVTKEVFDDITSTLSLPSVNSDYRTLALWPHYLRQAWSALKPIIEMPEFNAAADRIRECARALAQKLPLAVNLSPALVKETGDDLAQIQKMTSNFEHILPPLILNIALLIRELESDESVLLSPFPAEVRMAGSPVGAT